MPESLAAMIERSGGRISKPPRQRKVASHMNCKAPSALEETVMLTLRAHGLPLPIREHQAIPDRKWRLDMAYPAQKVAIECQGGIYSQGAHAQGARIEADHEKLNTLQVAGWIVLQLGPKAIRSAAWVEDLKRCLVNRGARLFTSEKV